MSIIAPDVDVMLSVLGLFSPADFTPDNLLGFARLMVGQEDCDPYYEDCSVVEEECDPYYDADCPYPDEGFNWNYLFSTVFEFTLLAIFWPLIIPFFGVLFLAIVVSFAAIPFIMVFGGIAIFGSMILILIAAIVLLIMASPFLFALFCVWFVVIGIPFLIYLALDYLFPGVFTWVGE